MKYLVMIPLACASYTLQAAVYKCSDASGKTVYQASPCQATEKGRELPIKTDPKVEADAKFKLEALQMQLTADKAQKQQAAEEESRQRYRTEQLEALQRNAIAQQQRAIAEQREADALEKRNQLNTSPISQAPPILGILPPPGITPAQTFGDTPPPAQGINQDPSSHNTRSREPEVQTATHGRQEQQQTIGHRPTERSESPQAKHQNPKPWSKDER
jgi:hypothetical protein